MKQLIIVLLLVFLVGGRSFGQQVLRQETHKVASNHVELVDMDEAEGTFTVILREKRKRNILLVQVNTYRIEDLSLVASKTEEIDLDNDSDVGIGAYQSARLYARNSGPTRLLKAGMNPATGQFILKRGYFEWQLRGRTWVRNFITEEKLKPKGIEGSKMELITYATDEPRFTNAFGMGFQGQNNMSVAKGNVTICLYAREEPYYTKYVFGTWSAETLERLETHSLNFERPYFPITTRIMDNGDFGLLFADPESKAGVPMLFVRTDAYGKELERVEVPLEVTGMHNLWIAEDEAGVHINGLTSSNDAFRIVKVGSAITMGSDASGTPGNRMDFSNKPTHLTFATIQGGKTTFIDQTSISAHFGTGVVVTGDKAKLPSPDKAEKEFKWNKTGYGTFFSKSHNGRTFVLGHDYNKALHFVAQYKQGEGLEKTYFKTRTLPTGPNQYFYFANDKLIWLVGEEDTEKQEANFSMLGINPETGDATELFNMEKGWHPSPLSFMNIYQGDKGAIMLSLDDKGKKLQLTKIAF